MARPATALARRSLHIADLRRSSSSFLRPATTTAAAAAAAGPPAMAFEASTPAPPPLPVAPTHAAGLAARHGAATPALFFSGNPAAGPLTFGALAAAAAQVAASLKGVTETARALPSDPALPPCGPRVAILARPGPAYAAALWGAWAAGCVAVPLHAPYPPPALAHPVSDAGCVAVYVGGGVPWPDAGTAVVEAVVGKDDATPPSLVDLDAAVVGGGGGGDGENASLLPPLSPPSHGAVLLYTSGTTGPPKGALHTGDGLAAQAASLAAAWGLGRGDVVLNALPLHHIHGLVNALVAPLAVGAAVELAPAFSPTAVWAALVRGLEEGGEGGGEVEAGAGAHPPPPTVLMAVPTMYAYLLDAYDGMSPADQAAARAGAARLRLAVCGSAACPAPTASRWAALAGQSLLERYGMTEAGMVLGQTAAGAARVRGTVGMPMPGVAVGVVPTPTAPGEGEGGSPPPPPPPSSSLVTGELLVRWNGLFAGYWRRPNATADAFAPGGWFRTGDVVAVEEREGTPGTFSILGRASTDILKVGGFKVSALQVEDALLAHPGVAEAAVVGVPGGARGDAVAAAVVVRGGGVCVPSPASLSAWVAARLPPAAVPRAEAVVLVDSLPRNALGKVDKKGVRRGVFGQ